MKVIVCVSIIAVCGIVDGANNCRTEPKCQIAKAHGMLGADCFNRDFREFPKCISSSVEIIDLTKNRIKHLSSSDLERFGSLQMLYLQDNFLLKIEEDTFNGKNYLTTLDLSNNGLTKVPLTLFHLDSLRTLYLGQNMNNNIVEMIKETVPITSPLQHFDISFNELESLPNMGVLPHLVKYNISGNNLLELKPNNFAGLCSLVHLVTSNVTVTLDKPCDCWDTNRWLLDKNIKFIPFQCEVAESSCEVKEFSKTDENIYKKCELLYKEITNRSLLWKIIVPMLLCLLIILVILGYCYMKKRGQRQKALHLKLSHDDKVESSTAKTIYQIL